MTSAASHQLPLNGNKLRFSIIFMLICCFAPVANAQSFVQKVYKVALVMPFKLDGNRGAIGEAMLDYYEGVMLAVDDLKSKGMNMDLHVFDTKKDSLESINIFENEAMLDMDIIVGPVYASELQAAEEFCIQHNKILISPLKFYQPKNKEKLKLINFIPTDSCKIKGLAETLFLKYPKHKVYLMVDKTKESKDNAKWFTSEYTKAGGSGIARVDITLPTAKILPGKDSFLLVATSKPELQNGKGAKLNAMGKNGLLVGFDEWIEKASGSTIASLNNAKRVYFYTSFVDYSDTFTKLFRVKYREEMKGEPTKYTMVGFDQFVFLGEALMAFGTDFPVYVQNFHFQSLTTDIYFKETSYGLENMGTNLVMLRDYKLIRVRR